MWVKFDREFMWTPDIDRRRSFNYSPTGGDAGRYSVTRACGEAAIAAGAAKRCVSPRSETLTNDEVDRAREAAPPAAETADGGAE